MRLRNTPYAYGAAARALHWSIVAVVIALVASAVVADSLPRGEPRGLLFGLHRSLGVLVLPLVATRVLWRLYDRPPNAAPDLSPQERIAAHAVHLALYAVIAIQPLTGLLMYVLDGEEVGVFGLFVVPAISSLDGWPEALRSAHEALAWAIYLLLLLHIGGATRHVLRGDGVINRMLGGKAA